MKLTATPSDLISSLYRDADFRLPVVIPKILYQRRIRDYAALGTGLLRELLFETPIFR
jgi:hypothetical protein